jgi:hypothetical protein
MPKASVREYDHPSGRKHKIGRAWQITAMNPVPISHAMNKPTDNKLWFRVD